MDIKIDLYQALKDIKHSKSPLKYILTDLVQLNNIVFEFNAKITLSKDFLFVNKYISKFKIPNRHEINLNFIINCFDNQMINNDIYFLKYQ